MSGYGDMQNIEEWFLLQDESCFPTISYKDKEYPYPQKYGLLKTALTKYHNQVEIGALLKSLIDNKKELEQKLHKNSDSDVIEKLTAIDKFMEADSSIYLNQHGTGHVDKVIERLSDMISKFRFDPPTPSEMFILLCAIQIHDIGNIFGRADHERSFQSLFKEIAKPIIYDTITQKFIMKIAQVHSGNIHNNKDTITSANLRLDAKWFNQTIREPVLAALLRFADELADDSTRYDSVSYELNKIPEQSMIYHAYSKSLHAVNICDNDVNKSCYISLEYYLDATEIIKVYKKKDSTLLLIDEIFARTKKMEQERRYCMRFLSPFLPLTEIRVRIEVEAPYDLIDSEVITYSLKENGYPNDTVLIESDTNEGYKVIKLLQSKGWRLNNELSDS